MVVCLSACLQGYAVVIVWIIIQFLSCDLKEVRDFGRDLDLDPSWSYYFIVHFSVKNEGE